MTRRPPANIAASIHARLRNVARERGRPFDELLQYYAMERFLYRLSQSAQQPAFDGPLIVMSPVVTSENPPMPLFWNKRFVESAIPWEPVRKRSRSPSLS